MDKVIQKALADLDGLSEEAIKRRILGMGEGEEAEEEVGPHPIAETAEKAVAEAVGEPTEEGEDIDPELLEKLREALSK